VAGSTRQLEALAITSNSCRNGSGAAGRKCYVERSLHLIVHSMARLEACLALVATERRRWQSILQIGDDHDNA
jgi:hypothetical protein